MWISLLLCVYHLCQKAVLTSVLKPQDQLVSVNLKTPGYKQEKQLPQIKIVAFLKNLESNALRFTTLIMHLEKQRYLYALVPGIGLCGIWAYFLNLFRGYV